MQAFFTRALCSFVDYPQYTFHPPLRAQVLDFLDQQCCERVCPCGECELDLR